MHWYNGQEQDQSCILLPYPTYSHLYGIRRRHQFYRCWTNLSTCPHSLLSWFSRTWSYREPSLNWPIGWQRCDIGLHQGGCWILTLTYVITGVKLGGGKRENKKYMVRPSTTLPESSSSANLLTWHLCLSHLGEISIQRLHIKAQLRWRIGKGVRWFIF